MNGAQGGNLQNVLSISTAANNRYLLHFNSLGSLTQWTAGIRLAMFEHATLQEAYTGSLIAGKGRYLNSIQQIMFPLKFPHDDWARVRFGAGTPWKRCWCVVSPPEEKEEKKAQKALKKSAYEKVKMPKGNVKFYETRKITKKTKPVATISDAYAAYAIYPQSKPLIEQSTLVKIEGMMTIHGAQEQTSEGFVFIMPEAHSAVSGFEIMLKFLFPVFDAFNLYGRPTKLVSDPLDQRGLMFAIPKDRRYGYLDLLDVSGVIHTKGSQSWSERQWRKEMKKLTAERMSTRTDSSRFSRVESRRRVGTMSQISLPSAARSSVRFGTGDDAMRSSPNSRTGSPPGRMSMDESQMPPPMRSETLPINSNTSPHKRSASDAPGYRRYANEDGDRDEMTNGSMPPPPPRHAGPSSTILTVPRSRGPVPLERIQSEAEVPTTASLNELQAQVVTPQLAAPVPMAPPAFAHQPNSRPTREPYAAPELRRANSNVDAATLAEMKDAARRDRTPDGRTSGESGSAGGLWNQELLQSQQDTVSSEPYANRNLRVPADRPEGVYNRQQRDPRQRLSSIPGSPYVANGDHFSQAPQQTQTPQTSAVKEEQTTAQQDLAQPGRPAPPVPIHSSHSISRKPVPRSSESSEEPPVPRSTSEMLRSPSPDSPIAESWAGGMIDEAALARVLNAPERDAPERDAPARSQTMQTTTTESTDPDYASTISTSTKPKQSMERPRAGKLKTVGNPDYQPIANDFTNRDVAAGLVAPAPASTSVLDVNFGPTYAYRPDGRSGAVTPVAVANRPRDSSTDRLGGELTNRLSGMPGNSPSASARENRRQSYFGGRATPTSNGITPEPQREQVGIPWQPAASAGVLQRSQTSVTPEQWVHQRASAAQQQPQYAPPTRKGLMSRFSSSQERSQSAEGTRKLTKTPPLNRALSGDWARGRQTPPPRPSSRGAGINLDSAGHSLSASQQMQVARATGTPLVNLGQTSTISQVAGDPGMFGVVAQREQDRSASRQGRNSMYVDQAIAERQQQQLRMEAEARAQQQYQMQMQASQYMPPRANWNQQAYMPNGQPSAYQYAQQMTQRSHSHSPSHATSWQAPQAQYFDGQRGVSPGRQQQQSIPFQAAQQAYGASYLAQQERQQQEQGRWARQGGQWSRR